MLEISVSFTVSAENDAEENPPLSPHPAAELSAQNEASGSAWTVKLSNGPLSHIAAVNKSFDFGATR